MSRYDYGHTAPAPKPKPHRSLVVLLAAAFVFCLVGAVFLAASGGDKPGGVSATDSPGEIVGEQSAKAARSAAPAKPKGPRTQIAGDDLVHVGEDVPPGVYRAVEGVGGGFGCYWKKSKDAEGDQIIDNDIVQGGRPQVTLKSGQWFTSQACPEWRAK